MKKSERKIASYRSSKSISLIKWNFLIKPITDLKKFLKKLKLKLKDEREVDNSGKDLNQNDDINVDEKER